MISEFLTLLAGALAPVALPPQAPGTIRGQVVDSMDRPLEAVLVTVNPENQALYTRRVEGSGSHAS